VILETFFSYKVLGPGGRPWFYGSRGRPWFYAFLSFLANHLWGRSCTACI